MGNLVPVKALKDDSGHWYVIPADCEEEFDLDLEDETDEYGNNFNDKWGKYRTGGDLNLIQLYAEIPPQGDAGAE